MLAYHMTCEAVGVCVGLFLRGRQDIHLAMRLFERLYDPVIFKPASPTEDRLRIGLKRMPELYQSAFFQAGQRFVVPMDNLSVPPGAQSRSAFPFEPPDEPPRDCSHKGGVEEILAPVLIGHLSFI